MAEQRYRLVFAGEVSPGQDVEAVKDNLAARLKLDSGQVARLFSGKRTVIRKGVDRRKAQKYESAFLRAGAVLKIENLTEDQVETPAGPTRKPATVNNPGPRNSEPESEHAVPPSSLVNSQAAAKSPKRIDYPAVIVFAMGLIALIGVSGYLAWQGLKPRPVKKRTAVSFSPADHLLIKRLHQEGLKLTRKGEFEKAAPLYRKRLEIIRAKGGETHPALPSAMNDLAFVLREQNKLEEAEKLYLEVIAICEETGRGEKLTMAVASEGLAKIYFEKGDFEQIEPLYQTAIAIWDRTRGPDNPNTLTIKQRRADLLEKLGREEEAGELRAYVHNVRKELWEKAQSKPPSSAASPQVNQAAGSEIRKPESAAAFKEAEKIPVSISKSFAPVKMTVAARSGFHPKLSDTPPVVIVREPKYEGSSQKYGKLILGTRKNRTYHFVLDNKQGSHPVLYFDRNQNGDLTDDGPPLENRGTGIFGTTITLPMKQLNAELDDAGEFKIWFFTNDALWPKGITRHYSTTQMKGQVKIKGTPYLGYLAERGANDADFRNDGIFLDFNRNGKIESPDEYVGDRQVASINGEAYWFDVQW
jgi:tetratricopeptide (TPR) repeat protein